MHSRRLTALIAASAAVVLGLTACGGSGGSSSAGGAPNPDGTVTIGIGEPQHLLPSNSTDNNAYQALVGLFYPLIQFDRQSKPIMAQAQSVETKDSKVWTIKLKPGFTFTDGTPVTAQDYINAWNFAAYAPNGQATNYYFANIQGYPAMNPADGTPTAKTLTGLKAVDANTLQVTLIEPFIDFISEIGYTAFLPLPKAAFDANGAVKSGFEDHMIGDGPFKMTAAGWQHNKEIDMVKNDTFAGPKPKVAAVNLKSYLSLSTAYQDVLADKLDVLPQLGTSDLATAKADFGDRYLNSPRSAFEFLAFPTYDKSFSNVNVRRAISMAIDRNAQTKVIFANSQTPARSFVSPVLPGYRPDVCGEACQYNPAAAKTLYTANNGPAQIQISYNADGGHKEWVDATCNELQQNLGVQCVGKPEAKFADLLTKVEAKTPGVGMFRLGWVMDFPSMQDYLGPLYTTHGSSNYYGYSNPQFDKLVAEGSAQPTQAAAIAKWQQAEDILAKDLPVLPMRFGQNNYVISRFVSDVFVDLFSAVDLYTIQTSRQ